MSTPWFDAHLDLAYLALSGRDMHAADPAASGGPDAPGGITLPSLAAGHVRALLATIFIEPDGSPPAIAYASGDPESAHRAGVAQLNIYHRWLNQGLIRRLPHRGSTITLSPGPISLGILVEGADCIRTPDELSWWADQGVVAIGLAWAKQTRYAGGNTTDSGLTFLGRELITRMDARGIVHDISHLSDRSLDELFDLATGPIMASHSNCRELIDAPGDAPRQRHLTNATIRELARRNGMIGLNIFSPFIIKGGKRDRRANPDEWAAHVDHCCDIMQSRAHVGLGSDADGGFSALMQPSGIDRPEHYPLLLDALSRRGWSDTDLANFASGNWQRWWSQKP